ncbi:MAG: BlaI/MecI/CopY family transcriptional regulator [Roseburia sp.]|nr:BlaI/MecI/CopY family transcriptional regulator [Roseburia sp.]
MEKVNEKMIELSGCEKLILGCIYEYYKKNEKAPNLKDITAILELRHGIAWKLQTICTFFTRMEKKGLITTAKNGRYTYYYPVMSFEEYVKKELNELCDAYFESDLKQLKRFVRQWQR